MQKNFELAVWTHGAVEKAKEAADETHTVEEMTKIFVYDAKNIVSIWGPHGEIDDYSSREWSKLIGEYYYGRWERYFNLFFDSILNEKPFDSQLFHNISIAWGQEWDARVRNHSMSFRLMIVQPDLYEIHHINPTETIEKANTELFVESLNQFKLVEGMTMKKKAGYHTARQQDPRRCSEEE